MQKNLIPRQVVLKQTLRWSSITKNLGKRCLLSTKHIFKQKRWKRPKKKVKLPRMHHRTTKGFTTVFFPKNVTSPLKQNLIWLKAMNFRLTLLWGCFRTTKNLMKKRKWGLSKRKTLTQQCQMRSKMLSAILTKNLLVNQVASQNKRLFFKISPKNG